MRRGFLLASLLLPICIAAFPAEAANQSAVPNRYGAIAYHRESQSWGLSFDKARARDANVQALQQCGRKQCEVVHKFKNGCAALAEGPKTFAAVSGATRDEAETKTLRRCSEKNGGKDCTLIAWACTR
jgi:Domain of unknown function (DUF4189)